MKKAVFFGADLRNANLSSVDLHGAEFAECDCRRASFSRSELVGAIFTYSDLRKTQFDSADMTACVFSRVDMTGARLSNAILDSTSFYEVNLADANVTGVLFYKTASFCRINAATCFGHPLFKRYAEDQDYIASRIDEIKIERFLNSKNLSRLRQDIASNSAESPIKLRGKLSDQLRLRYWEPLRLGAHEVWLWLWARIDYGRSFSRVALMAAVLSIVFGVAYSTGDMLHFDEGVTPNWWYTPFYYSIVTYTTLGFGDVTPKSEWGQVLVTIEVILGYLTLGLLISILANKVARRS